ncbi:MAG: hypothetical protein CMO74_15265 [Verrucomicrobiales bacterium]|nr:hypothetical protein [Verrucomicrobiales bacterium]
MTDTAPPWPIEILGGKRSESRREDWLPPMPGNPPPAPPAPPAFPGKIMFPDIGRRPAMVGRTNCTRRTRVVNLRLRD